MNKTNNLKKTANAVLLSACMLFFVTSCDKSDDPKPDPVGNHPPIVLECDYFLQDRVLVDDPEAPVDYIIACGMQIKADVKIEPGVVVEFEQAAYLRVYSNGSLNAVGTSDKSIIFRGTDDSKGFWGGIFYDGSTSPKNELKFVEVSGGGSKGFANAYEGGVMVYAGTKLKMSNSKISNSSNYGFNANLLSSASALDIHDNVFTDNKYPAYISGAAIGAFKGSNSCKGNEEDYVLVRDRQILENATWHKIDVKYRIGGGGHIGVYKILTIQPGVEIEFPQDGKIKLDHVAGGLKAVGTTSDPIILTGVSKTPKAWNGLYISGGYSENEIAYTKISYSGLDTPAANVYLDYNAFLNIHDVTFSNIIGCAINYSGASNPNLTVGSNIQIDAGGCLSNRWR